MSSQEPEFRAWRISRMKGLRVLCIIAVPIGIVMGIPAVWILGILGIIASTIKLEMQK